MRPARRSIGQPRRRPKKNSAARRSGAAAPAMAKATAARMAVTGVVAGVGVDMVKVGVATLTTAAEEATAVEEARQVAAVTRDTARMSGEVTAVADAPSGEVAGDDGTVLGVATLTVQP